MDRHDSESEGDNRLVLGYVVENVDEPVTVCTDCFDLFSETEDVIRDNNAYGDQVPYPECYECGEVMRP